MAELENEAVKKVTKLETRIQNKLDSLDNWNNSSIELLSGEIAIVKTPEEPTYGDTAETRSTPTVAMKIGELDEKGKPKLFKDLPWVSDRTAIHQGGALTKGLRLGNTADGAIKDSTGQNTVLGIDENNNLNFGSTNYSTQIKGKYSRPKYVTPENNEGQDLALLADLSTVAKTGNFDDLINLPFYSSKINVPWDGNTDGKTKVLTSVISNINSELSYYNVSDKIVSVDAVKGGVFSVKYNGSVSSYDINEIGSEIFYSDGKDSGSFFVTSEYLGYSPFIFCVEKPETMTITTEALGTFTITFPESGIYFLSSMGYTVANFTASKKLSNEFISYDTTPTKNSENLITSGAVYTANENIKESLSTVAITNDFNDLMNLPFYHSPFNITWNGDTTGLTEVLTNIIIGTETQQLLFYKLSDQVISSGSVVGANVHVVLDGEKNYTVTTSDIKFADGKTSGSFYLTFENMNNMPLVFCIQEPTTFVKTIAIDETTEVTAEFEFTEAGIYSINMDGAYIASFSKEGKQLDKEFIPDIYQEKLSCPQLDTGFCSSNSTGNFIYNYIYFANNASNPNADLQKLAYNITTDSFVLPIIMNTTVNPTDGTMTLKVVTSVDSQLNPTDSISIDISCETPLYDTKTYFLIAFKLGNGTWQGTITGKIDSPVDTTPTSGSENLITSGGVYTANESIKESLATVATTGSYNDLKNLPCYEKDPSLYFNNIYWNGDISSATLGAEATIEGMPPLQWYKVSDTIISNAKALPGCLVTFSDGDDVIIPNDDPDMPVRNCSDKGSVQAGFFVISIAQNNDTVSISYGADTEISLTFAETGTYFAYVSSPEETTFVQNLSYNSSVKLSEELLPSNIRDYEYLYNKPFYVSVGSLYTGDPETSWRVVATTNTIEALGSPLSYYKVSEEFFVPGLKNITKLGIFEDENITQISIDQTHIKYSNDLNSKSYAVFVNNLPFVYAIQQPAETVAITFDGIGEVTATFPEAGIYFLKYTTTEGEIQHTRYASELRYEEITKIDNKYLPINTTISATSTDDTIPSSKAIYDFVQSTINESVIAALERSY